MARQNRGTSRYDTALNDTKGDINPEKILQHIYKKETIWLKSLPTHPFLNLELHGEDHNSSTTLWGDVTLSHTLTHTTFFVCLAAALTAALLVLAETPTCCCCCCCCSARSRHFPALWSVSTARAGPEPGSLQDLIGCLNYSGGVGVAGKNHFWHLWTQYFF